MFTSCIIYRVNILFKNDVMILNSACSQCPCCFSTVYKYIGTVTDVAKQEFLINYKSHDANGLAQSQTVGSVGLWVRTSLLPHVGSVRGEMAAALSRALKLPGKMPH